MQLTLGMYLIVLPMVFLAAVVDSIGGGGGLISLPAYTLAGLNYGHASGCNKFSSCFGTLSSTIKFARSGKILWVPALLAAATALLGSWLGTRVSMLLSAQFMNWFMLVAVPVVGLLVALKKDVETESKPLTGTRKALCLLVGLIVGFYDGFFGPGTGTFLILLFTSMTGMDMVTASATSKPVNLASNIASLITRLLAGQVIFALAVPAMVLSVLGNQLGTHLALKRGAKFIRYVMLGVLVLLTVKLAVDLF